MRDPLDPTLSLEPTAEEIAAATDAIETIDVADVEPVAPDKTFADFGVEARSARRWPRPASSTRSRSRR